MNNLYVDDEVMQGNPSQLIQFLQQEMANQILEMETKNYENICYNMRMIADVFEMLEENINEKFITLRFNPMGSWYIEDVY